MQARRALNWVALFLAFWILPDVPAHAGMTVYGLRDIYRLRLEEISFFVVLLLVCALGLKLLWNYSFNAFRNVPRLKYLQALSVSVMFGLVMLLILTMISGIREVLTPGAWRKQGTSYRLNDPSQEPARRRSLEYLRVALMEYARTHEGQFPRNDFIPEIPEKLWESPDQSGSRYIYTGGLCTNDTNALLAIEPVNFGERRFVLNSSGEIELLSNEEIQHRLGGGTQP